MPPKQVSPFVKKKNDAERKRRERQQHQNDVEIIVALNRVSREIAASRNQEHRYERKKGLREWLTIVSVALAAIAAVLTIVVNHGDVRHTLKDAKFVGQLIYLIGYIEYFDVFSDAPAHTADWCYLVTPIDPADEDFSFSAKYYFVNHRPGTNANDQK